MTAALPATADIERLRALVGAALGLDLDEGKHALLADVLRSRSQATGVDAPAYLDALAASPQPQELRRLAAEFTVTETSFFRNVEQFDAFGAVVLPDRIAARTATRSLRILSAGCASGEEAYSLAAATRDCAGLAGWNVAIRGIDVNPSALRKARAGRYSDWSLRQTHAAERARLFRREGASFVLEPAIRTMVSFEERNLTRDDAQFWAPDSFDVIFCRNVLMYFAPETMRSVIARLTRSLSPGGFLFLGHAETLRGLSTDFHLRHGQGAFYYQRRETAEALRPIGFVPSRPPETRPVPSEATATPMARGANWVDAIRDAARRIDALAAKPTARPRPTAPGDLRDAVALIERERFDDARELLRALPDASAHDPEVLLLHAVLHSHGGDLAAAERTCTELLALDEMNAGAHYLMALCRESAGDEEGAVAQDRIAAHLDPGFAMPRLHLGLLARRAGERDEARHQLRHALLLIEHEDSARLLLFGGGFSRGALRTLCRAELAACGGMA